MDLIACAVEKKIINEEVYRNLAVKTTKNLLESYGYECGEKIGEGAFGDVIEIENKRTSSKVAGKIVLNNYITKSETELWPKLKNDYILPLLGKVSFMDAPTTVFFSPLCQGSLGNKLEEDCFLKKRNIFKVLKNYMHDIVRGLGFVHGKNLNHLDLKLTNVLIKKDGKACICDFGCVCSADKLVDRLVVTLKVLG